MVALRVALICDRSPVRVTVWVPLPAMVAAPPVTARVPWVTLRVTVMLPLAASTSATLRPVMKSGVSSAVVCAAGTVLTGASLTALMVMATVSEASENAVVPPVLETVGLLPAVPVVWSQATNVSASAVVPLKLAAGW